MKNMRSFLKSLILTPCIKFFKHDCRMLIHFQKCSNPRNLLEPSPRKCSTKGNSSHSLNPPSSLGVFKILNNEGGGEKISKLMA